MQAIKVAAALVVLAASVVARPAHADAVDDAVTQARQAAGQKKWTEAAKAYEQARVLLPGRSSALALELGTAYAHLSRWGYATLHLSRALQREVEAAPEVLQAARHNLGVVRRQVEGQARTQGARLSRSEDGWDVVRAVLASPWCGWIAWLAGASAGLLALALRSHRLQRLVRVRSALGVSALVAGSLWLIVGLCHGFAREHQGLATHVVIGAAAAMYEGPGTHRPRLFAVQAGSKVVVLEETPGWLRVRLVGGPQGWLARDQSAPLDGAEGQIAPAPL